MSDSARADEIDVRELIPIKRHELLLKKFKELPVGESFVFVNDHDPKPLYYEFRSIHGDVVDWEYLQTGGREWRVMVTRIESSQGREFVEISTLMDLRKVAASEWKYVIFHRYGMMKLGDTMEIIAESDPEELHNMFTRRYKDDYTWETKSSEAGKYVIHITKDAITPKNQNLEDAIKVVKDFDVRPYPPAQRHDMVFDTFDEIKAGESFIFTNDHDPKPLYYQIEAENKVPFKWDYLESGPDVWKVQVTKTK